MTIWREGGREIGDCDKKWGEICSLIRTGKLRMNYRVRGRGRRKKQVNPQTGIRMRPLIHIQSSHRIA